MSYPSFPTLVKKPVFPLKQKGFDRGIASEMEDGSMITREKYSAAPKTFTVNYIAMSNADWTALENFYHNTVKGCSLIFTWAHPQSGTTYKVRFLPGDPLEGVLSAVGWSVEFSLVEAVDVA